MKTENEKKLNADKIFIEPYAGAFLIADYSGEPGGTGKYCGYDMSWRGQPIVNKPFRKKEEAIIAAMKHFFPDTYVEPHNDVTISGQIKFITRLIWEKKAESENILNAKAENADEQRMKLRTVARLAEEEDSLKAIYGSLRQLEISKSAFENTINFDQENPEKIKT